MRLLIPLAAALTTLYPAAAGAQAARAISQADLVQGRQANPQLLAEYGGRYDGPQAALVERVGKRVALQSGLSNAQGDFTVQLLDSPIENAFAIPGGYIYVTRQLLALMNSEDELAFVMGHEVGHVAARHSAGRQRTSAIGSVLAGVVGAVAGNSALGQLAGAGAQRASQLVTLRYGRDQEYQADTLGIRYVAAAGYDPNAAPLILGQLGASTTLEALVAGRDGNVVPTWLSTHPSSRARVTRAQGLAQQARSETRAQAQDTTFLRMLDGLLYDNDPAQGVIDGRAFLQPTMRIRFTAPEGYTITNTASAVSVQGGGGLARLTASDGGTDLVTAVTQRFQSLGAQVAKDQVRSVTFGGQRAAIATVEAVANKQRLDASIVAVQLASSTYLWTLVTAPGSGVGPFEELLASLASMSPAEAKAVRGKRVRIQMVRAGDTIDSLADQMAYRTLRRERFMTLNDLDDTTLLAPGTLVKLVVTG